MVAIAGKPKLFSSLLEGEVWFVHEVCRECEMIFGL